MDTDIDVDYDQKVILLGGLGYTARQCFNILGLEDEEYDQFVKDFDNNDSDFRKLYEKGVDKADFEIDSKLLVLAQTGDLKALSEYERRKIKHQQYRK